MDSIEQKALPGATISIQNADGIILQSATTGKNGNFSIATTGGIPQQIRISFASYKEKLIPVEQDEPGVYDFGTIYLYLHSYSLAEVVVSGKRPPVSFKIDRQVYQPSQFGNAANGTGVDVIRNLPSVSVNGQGDITFRGSSSFQILINGKPTQGAPSFVLSQLPAGSIENVEVITSPSAAYDAEGKSGIINIVTKNNVEDGWMIQANVMGGAPPLNDFDNQRQTHPQRYGADFTAGYNKNKWGFNAGINYLRNDIAGFREGDVYTIINNTKTSFPSTGERSFKRYNYGARVSVNYRPDRYNTLSSGFYIGKKYQSRVADLVYTNSREDLDAGSTSYFTYFNANTQNKEGVFTLANLDYSHEFKNESKLSFSALFERANLSGNTYNNNLNYPNTADTLQYTWNPNTNPLNAYRGKIDYSIPLGNGKLQTGYQYQYILQDGNFEYLTKIPGTENYETDPVFTSRVKVNNDIHAGYVQYNASADRWDYAAGLRFEHTDRELDFTNNSVVNRLSFTNLFPSVQLRYAAWHRGIAKIGYNRRIKRTNNFELNPFPEREHSETLEQGDPNLLPELTGTFEAGIEQTFPKGNLFFTVYHQRIQNPIQRVNKIFADTILNRVFTNAGRATQTGFETNFTMQVNKAWQTIVGGNVYSYKIKGNIFNGQIPINNSSWVYSINSTQSFSIPKNWQFQLSVNYLSLRATAQGEDGAFLTPHLTVKKTTNDKRWYFQFQWLNIDAGMKISNRQRITTWGNDFHTTTNYIYEPDQLQFSVGFNLLRKNRKIILPQSEIGEKEF
ncbi:TonB-dependent receptor [Niabella terrae]